MASDALPLHTEEPGVSTRWVLLLVGSFLATVVVLMVGLAFYYRGVVAADTLVVPPRAFPAPQIQPNPTQDYVNFLVSQEKQREGFAWADKPQGLVHVPVERAMAFVAGRGAQAYDPVPGTPPWTVAAPLDGAPRARPAEPVAPYGLAQ